MKNKIRQEKRLLRKQLTAKTRESFSREISNKLIESDLYRNSNNIMLYQAINGEVDLSEFIRAAQRDGKKLCYPKCISKTEMIALVPGENAWITGRFGITEPDAELSEQMSPADIDLMICPCTSFDENCNRLGMGAGYYDRFLEKATNAHIVAVAFEIQKADSIPMDEYDKIMDSVFTEKRIYLNDFERRIR